MLRDGQFTRLPTTNLVPGDVVRLEAGDRVPAEAGRRRRTRRDGGRVPAHRGIRSREWADDADVLSGTLIVRGRAHMTVTRTGAGSAMGRLAAMLGDIRTLKTPLERRVDRLGRQIAGGCWPSPWCWACLECWPRGSIAPSKSSSSPWRWPWRPCRRIASRARRSRWRLASTATAPPRGAVRRLSAVEALGSVTVVATDKTGTLTENRMDVKALDAGDLRRALSAIVLANDADPGTGAGNPLDLGLLRHAESQGVNVARLRHDHPAVSDRPFDSAWKFARVTVREDGRLASYLKGAPEVILPRCVLSEAERESWNEKAEAYAREGFRVLALAWADDEREERLVLLGVALFWGSTASRGAGCGERRSIGRHPCRRHHGRPSGHRPGDCA